MPWVLVLYIYSDLTAPSKLNFLPEFDQIPLNESNLKLIILIYECNSYRNRSMAKLIFVGVEF